MDEGDLTEYVALLTQIQSLMDSGMSEAEIQAMFPDINFSEALDQLAAIQTYLNDNKWDTNLTSLNEMFGDAVGEEVLKIATDLDMTGAQARWTEWAANPGSITTDAIVNSYTEAENAEKQQPAGRSLREQVHRSARRRGNRQPDPGGHPRVCQQVR